MLLLESAEFQKPSFFLKRNKLFKNVEMEQKMKISEVTKPFVKSLKVSEYDGLNILEYCLMYKQDNAMGYHNLCNH